MPGMSNLLAQGGTLRPQSGPLMIFSSAGGAGGPPAGGAADMQVGMHGVGGPTAGAGAGVGHGPENSLSLAAHAAAAMRLRAHKTAGGKASA